MKILSMAALAIMFSTTGLYLSAQTTKMSSAEAGGTKQLFLDVHRLTPGIKPEAVAQAHQKDLAVEGKYGVDFIKYWVAPDEGLVFCLASASDSESLRKTHAEAHGLLPDNIYLVEAGTEATLTGKNNLFLDIHYLGAGKVSVKDVAAAHEKDLAVEKKYGANFINYWVNEKEGVVMCLVEAKDSTALINTHKEAHGLLPDKIYRVKQGQ
ncbi:MAG TPA: DUF4242 domain-containing protein [Chitinophagaceae bacterium]|nr:DUF4242 domain-containing protein [Chitinophagaceae bacterium]